MKNVNFKQFCAASVSALLLAGATYMPAFAASNYSFYTESSSVSCSSNGNNVSVGFPNYSNNIYAGTSATINVGFCYPADSSATPELHVYENTTGTPLAQLKLGNHNTNTPIGTLADYATARAVSQTSGSNMGEPFNSGTVTYNVTGLTPDTEYVFYVDLILTSPPVGYIGGAITTTPYVELDLARNGVGPVLSQEQVNSYVSRSDTSVSFIVEKPTHTVFNSIDSNYVIGDTYSASENIPVSPKSSTSAGTLYEFSDLTPNTSYTLHIAYKNDGDVLEEKIVRFSTLGKTPEVTISEDTITIKDMSRPDGTTTTNVTGTIKKNNDDSAQPIPFYISSDEIKNGDEIIVKLSDINLDPNSEYTINATITHSATSGGRGETEDVVIVFATDANGKPIKVVSVNGRALADDSSDKNSVKNPSTLDPIAMSLGAIAVAGIAAASFVKFGKLSRRR